MTTRAGGNDAKAKLRLASAYREIGPHLNRMGARRALDGEDIGQDAAVRALQVKDASAIDDPLRYLCRVARTLFVDAERSRARERVVIDPAADLETRADP